jgi:hypothetical protein
VRNALVLLVSAALACAILAAPAAAAGAEASCPGGKVRVATGCVSRTAAQRHLAAIVRREMRVAGLKATILRIDTGTRPLIDQGFGDSMAGYTGIMAYLPSRGISVGLVTTQLPRAADTGVHYATVLFKKLTEYLTPQHVSALPE